MRYRNFCHGTRPALLLGLWFFVGCDSGSSPPGTAITTTGSLATSLAQAFCARQACCGVQTTDASVLPPGSADGGTVSGADAAPSDAGPSCVADPGSGAGAAPGGDSACQARALVAITKQLALVSTAVAEGLLTVNSVAATACVVGYQNRPCGGTQTALPDVQDALGSCVGLFTGYIQIGERCDMTPECVAHLFCLSQGTGQNVTSLAGSGSLGVCYPFQQAGQACNSSSDCDPSAELTCDSVTLTCQAPAA